MATAHSTPAAQTLAVQVRQRLVSLAGQGMAALLGVVQERLTALMNEGGRSRDVQLRREAWTYYQQHKTQWHDAVLQAWEKALTPQPVVVAQPADGLFELVGTEVVENKILASRLALNLMEHAAEEVNDLRKRLKLLNGERDLNPQDIAHPETLLLPVVEQWTACGMTREAWQLASEAIQRHMDEHLRAAYASCNEMLIAKGVLPVIEFSPHIPTASAGLPAAAGPVAAEGFVGRRQTDAPAPGPGRTPNRRAQDRVNEAAMQVNAQSSVGYAGYRAGEPMYGNPAGYLGARSAGPHWRGERAQSLLEQIGRLLGPAQAAPPMEGYAPTLYSAPASPNLLAAMAQQPMLGDVYLVQPVASGQSAVPEMMGHLAGQLRQQSTELKEKAQTDAEKAIIELVALMFQAILQEDRIPSGIRVWFARLQMPVLRVALQEPDFFQRLDHPARLLIDRMGSCVMGFDASGISSAALETEIKRVVQVIEQYPDTGQKVYVRVYEEFLAFLKKHLTQKPVTQKLVGVAQQVEQKETLAIQFTIEIRNQIQDMPVRDEIREFLFKVWAEVLAISAVRQGPKHEETLLLKKTASDLIWAASAKPNRADRARVISDLPELLQCLRAGLTLMNMPASEQEEHIKRVSAVLVEAFMSKTQAIADDQIQALAARLANLEDYISDDGAEELPLDAQSIEDLLDVDASSLDVITEGGGKASAVMLEWARELDLGAWFVLKYKDQESQVQYAWRSPMGHLHLFASNVGHSYLIQTVRLAAYLQAGLLETQETEPLTQRATRNALSQLQANPSQLLS
nr:DUF1631 family protein [uncultured Rhodoferax sp.]